MDSLYTDYFVYTRKQAVQKQSTIEEDIVKLWMFDYFTKHILNKEPISGLQFREIEGSQTRTAYIGEKCVDAYVDVGGYVTYKGRHCWQTIIYETVFDKDDNGEGSGGSGSNGSSGGSGSNGKQEEEDKGTTNIGHSGGGSNSSNNGDDSKPDSTPCDRANRLQADTAFVAQVGYMFDKIEFDPLEDGWIKSSKGSYIPPIERKAKSLKYSSKQLEGVIIYELYHTHPTGAPYPSFSDLKVIASKYKNGKIDITNFSYGVISVYGCTSIVITSPNDFHNFMVNLEDYLDNYNHMRNNTTKKDIESVVAKFIYFLNTSNSGLSVLFNRAENGILKTWKVSDSDDTINLQYKECN